MKREVRTLIIALACVAALAAAYFVLKAVMPENQGSGDNIDVIGSPSPTDYYALSVEYPENYSLGILRGYTYEISKGTDANGESTFIFYDGGIDDGFPYNASSMGSALSSALSFKAKEIVDENPEDLAQYGLGPDTAVRVSLRAVANSGREDIVFLVGAENSMVTGYYLKLEQSPEVYLVYPSAVTSYLTGSSAFRDLAILPNLGESNQNLKGVSLTNIRGDEIHLVYRQGGGGSSSFDSLIAFKMTAPYNAYMNDTAVGTKLIAPFTEASVMDVVINNPTEAELSELYFDQGCRITFELFTGTFSYRIGLPDGRTDVDGYYLLPDNVNTVFAVSGSAEFVSLTPINLRSSLVWAENIADVTEIVMTFPGGTHKLMLDDTYDADTDTGGFVGSLDGKALSSSEGRNLFERIISISYDDLVLTDEEISPETAYKFEITFRDKSRETIGYSRVTSRQYAVHFGETHNLKDAGFCANITSLQAVEEFVNSLLAK